LYPNVETGGDIFGQWLPSGECAIRHVIGPGADAQRSSVTFNQSLAYLKAASEVLGTKQAFHIGDWHSHHRLFDYPSGGDSRTCAIAMKNNNKAFFVLVIANIRDDVATNLPYVQISAFRYAADAKDPREFVLAAVEFIDKAPDYSAVHAELENVRAGGVLSLT